MLNLAIKMRKYNVMNFLCVEECNIGEYLEDYFCKKVIFILND